MIKYTSGNEFQFLDGTKYIGWYHIIKNKYYTGKRFVYGVSQKLKKVNLSINQNYFDYSQKFKSIIEKYQMPKQLQIITIPNDRENLDILTIYLVKNKFTNQVFEITKNSYKKIEKNQIFYKFQVSIKTGNSLSNIGYNRKQISIINDKNIIDYLIKVRKIL